MSGCAVNCCLSLCLRFRNLKTKKRTKQNTRLSNDIYICIWSIGISFMYLHLIFGYCFALQSNYRYPSCRQWFVIWARIFQFNAKIYQFVWLQIVWNSVLFVWVFIHLSLSWTKAKRMKHIKISTQLEANVVNNAGFRAKVRIAEFKKMVFRVKLFAKLGGGRVKKKTMKMKSQWYAYGNGCEMQVCA